MNQRARDEGIEVFLVSLEAGGDSLAGLFSIGPEQETQSRESKGKV
jgi:hypothetical protein